MYDEGEETSNAGAAVNEAADGAVAQLAASNAVEAQATKTSGADTSPDPQQAADPRYAALGAAITVLLAPQGASGLSHVGLLVTYGKDGQNGNQYYSFQTAGNDSGVPSAPGQLVQARIAAGTSVKQAVGIINEQRVNQPTPLVRYTSGVSFNVTSQAAVDAEDRIQGSFGQARYNLLFKNCTAAVDFALKAAGIRTPGLQALFPPSDYLFALSLLHILDRNATVLEF